MVTYSQQMGAGGTGINEQQGQGTKKGLMSGRTALFTLFVIMLALSVALPYGVGIAVFVGGIALIGALLGAGFAVVTLVQELFGKTPAFGYTPTAAYMSGKKMKKKAKEGSSDEEKKDVR
jgi:hypothetical protein